LVKYLDHPSPSFRRNAIEGLGNQKDPALVKILRPFLWDKEEDTRMRAIEALGELGGDEAFHLLVSVLADTTDGFISMRAAEALGKMGDVRAIEPLKKSRKRWDFQTENIQRNLDKYIQQIEKGGKGK
jgi:HEAT repeat protein